jgi:hypothetical protein
VASDDSGFRHAVATAVFGRWLRGEADLVRLREAIDWAGSGQVDAVHLESHRLMERAIAMTTGRE